MCGMQSRTCVHLPATQFTVCMSTPKVRPTSPIYLSKAIVHFLQVARIRLIEPHAKKAKVVQSVRSSRRYDRGGCVGSAGAEIRLISWNSISLYCILCTVCL